MLALRRASLAKTAASQSPKNLSEAQAKLARHRKSSRTASRTRRYTLSRRHSVNSFENPDGGVTAPSRNSHNGWSKVPRPHAARVAASVFVLVAMMRRPKNSYFCTGSKSRSSATNVLDWGSGQYLAEVLAEATTC